MNNPKRRQISCGEKLRTINRTAVNENGTLEQVTHYYLFGDVYDDVGLKASVQPYKYNSKELGRMYRLDWYNDGY